MVMTRIALVFGGRSPEHEVSIVSARFVAKQLAMAGFAVVPLGIGLDGSWVEGAQAFDRLVELTESPAQQGQFSPGERAPGTSLEQALSALSAAEPELVFPLIHGLSGEDGCLQGLCELLDLPYVGGDVLNQSLCYDKLATRQLLRSIGLPQPDFLAFHSSQLGAEREGAVRQIEEALPYPLFVKPSRTGSSIGVSKARNREQLHYALNLALEFDQRVVVERALVGREVEIAALGAHPPLLSCPGEVIPENEFYDYEEKYLKSSTRFVVPAALDTAVEQRMREDAQRAWLALHCFCLARIDFLVEGETAYLNEINTIPGFTPNSMYPRLLAASGVSPVQALREMVELGLQRGPASRRARPFLSRSDWFKVDNP
jgi:D-alanine-D-alanine ligase